MALYVRHAAWLNAVPDTKTSQPNSPAAKSRREALEDSGVTPDMPALEWGEYLVRHLFEFGPTMAAGMGNAPITAGEIASWQGLIGVQFHPWEARLLRRLSCEYARESTLACEANRPPPFAESTDTQQLQHLHKAEVERGLDVFLK